MSQFQSFAPQFNFPNGFLNGFQFGWVGNTTFTIGAGTCIDSTNSNDISVLSTSPWATSGLVTVNAAINGLNGLDTGTIAASTFYYVYVVSDPLGFNSPGYIMSLSGTTPLLPKGLSSSNYSQFRLIMTVLTDSSGFILKQYTTGNGSAKVVQYDAPITVLTAGAATTSAVIDLSPAVPVTGFGEVKLYSAYTPHAAAETVKFKPTGATADWHVQTGIVASVVQDEQFTILPLLASSKPEVSYIVSVGTSPAAVTVKVQSYSLLL